MFPIALAAVKKAKSVLAKKKNFAKSAIVLAGAMKVVVVAKSANSFLNKNLQHRLGIFVWCYVRLVENSARYRVLWNT
jgi:hypothetical protein